MKIRQRLYLTAAGFNCAIEEGIARAQSSLLSFSYVDVSIEILELDFLPTAIDLASH